jgi:hypothetical protein
MSAIGLSGPKTSGRKATSISAHADFRPQDFRFLRQQSRELAEAEWESRIQPLHSWGEIALYGAGTFVLVAAMVGMVV